MKDVDLSDDFHSALRELISTMISAAEMESGAGWSGPSYKYEKETTELERAIRALVRDEVLQMQRQGIAP